VQTPTFTPTAAAEFGGDGISQGVSGKKDAIVKGMETAASALRGKAETLGS
jgi:hypothetical protein